MDDQIFRKEIMKRMDAILKLLTILSMKENTQTEKIAILNSSGFAPKEIAEILNTSSNSVSVLLNKLKKGSEKKKTKDDKQRFDEGLEGEKENDNTTPLSNNKKEKESI